MEERWREEERERNDIDIRVTLLHTTILRSKEANDGGESESVYFMIMNLTDDTHLSP